LSFIPILDRSIGLGAMHRALQRLSDHPQELDETVRK
jgi:hypothetical protein